MILGEKSTKKVSNEMDVEQQTELMHQENTIWTAVFRADHEAINRLIDEDSNLIYTRGAVGECPIHVLFLCGSETHLAIARDLLQRNPSMVTQIYNKPVRNRCLLEYFVKFSEILDVLWRKYSSHRHCQTEFRDGRMASYSRLFEALPERIAEGTSNRRFFQNVRTNIDIDFSVNFLLIIFVFQRTTVVLWRNAVGICMLHKTMEHC